MTIKMTILTKYEYSTTVNWSHKIVVSKTKSPSTSTSILLSKYGKITHKIPGLINNKPDKSNTI